MIDLSTIQPPAQNDPSAMTGWQKALAGAGALGQLRNQETSPTGLMTPQLSAGQGVVAPPIGGTPYGKGFQTLMQPGLLKMLSGLLGKGAGAAGAAGAAGGGAAGGGVGATGASDVASMAALA